MTQLMISVQNLKEALEAYHLGADFIDLKDPSSGPLSPIDAPSARRICRELPPQVTLSQALGEWKDWRSEPGLLPSLPSGLDYAKIGFSGLKSQSAPGVQVQRNSSGSLSGRIQGQDPPWFQEFENWRNDVNETLATPPKWIAVHYADSQRVDGPSLNEILKLATQSFDGILIDTFHKDYGPDGLFHWLSEKDLEEILIKTKKARLTCALAGSLSYSGIEKVVRLNADIVGVRSLVTERGERISALDSGAVSQVIRFVREENNKTLQTA